MKHLYTHTTVAFTQTNGWIDLERKKAKDTGFVKQPCIGGVKRKLAGVICILFTMLFTQMQAAGQSIAGASSVCVGASVTMSATAGGGTWSSSNTAVATVDAASGIVTGVMAGTATISYSLAGIAATTALSVSGLPSAGSISGPSAVCISGSITLTSSATGGWWSAANAIATVGSTTGVVTGVALGADTIIYTVTNACGSASVQVVLPVKGVVGNMYTLGGTGTATLSGDGGPAFLANINPRDMVADNSGNLFVCEPTNAVVRKISTSGMITRVAGTGTAGNSGDGGPASAAAINAPNGVFVDNSGNIFISSTNSHVIKKIDGSTGTISTIAGTAGTVGFSGDGGPATAATLNFPLGLCTDDAGNLYVADEVNNRVRKISATTGNITTVAGNGTASYTGDNGPGTAASISSPRDVKMDNKGNLYIADAGNNVIRKYVPSTGMITTLAGTGAAGYSGDGGPATAAVLTTPARFAYDGANLLYISDQSNNVIRQINLVTGNIRTTAGSGTSGFSGDYGDAGTANLSQPAGIAVDHFGNFFIADGANRRIRVVPSKGSIANNISGPDHICTGTPVTFSSFLSVSGSATYTWQKNGANITGSGSSYTASAPANGDSYRYIATITPACSSTFSDTSNSISLTVDRPASVIVGAGDFACIGGTLNLIDSAAGGAWTTSAPTIATVNTNGILSGVSSGTTLITYSLTNACGFSSSTATVTVNPMVTISATVGPNGTIAPTPPVVVCSGNSQVFTFIPNPGYHVSTLSVDGSTVTAAPTYTFTAVSGDHNIDNITFEPDCLAPAITVCPGSITTASDGGSCAAMVTYSAATATGTSPAITYSQASGTSFAVGTTIVTVNATNSCGTATCTFPVTVNDTQAPVITAPANVSVNTNPGACVASGYSLGAPVTTDNCGVAGVSSNDAGSYAPGSSTVTWTVTDIHGNTATAAQNIVVTDNQNPTIAAPTDQTVFTNTGCTATGVATGSPVTSDNCSVANVVNNHPSASYSLGANVITWTVTDASSNTATATQTITVTDNVNPVISAPANINANSDPGSCFATVSSLGTPVTSDNCTVAGVVNDHASASFAVGTTTVTWTVTDGSGNTATATQTVTVTDNQNPTITAPADITISGWCRAVSLSDAGVSLGMPLTADNCGVASVTNNAPSTFPVGNTTVTWTVTDIHGNTATASQLVTVAPAAITVAATATGVSCNAANTGNHSNGSIATTVAGGTPAYTYAWNNGSVTANLTGMATGSYTVTVTDAHSCVAAATATIGQPASLTISSIAATGVSCNSSNTGNHANGSLATTVSGGTGTYSFAWSNGANVVNPAGLSAGTYSVTVTDANGCVANSSATVGQPAAIAVTTTVANVSCNAANGGNHTNGSIATSVSGGTGSYSYTWSNGTATANPAGLSAGTYTVTVTDANACSVAAAATVVQPSALAVSAVATNVSCNSANGGSHANGSITTTVSGGTGSCSYAWAGGATGANPSGLSAGTYTVTVTDAHSCTSSTSATVSQPAAISCTISGSSSVLGGTTNNFTTPSGMATYSWTLSGSGSSISGSTNGSSVSVPSTCSASTYTVSLTSTNTSACSCAATRTVTVTQSATITVNSGLYTTGSGWYPSVSKTALPVSLKVFDRSVCGARDFNQSHYSSVWNSTTGLITNAVVSGPNSVTLGSGPVNQYTVTVPAGGHYLIVGKSDISSSYYSGSNCTIYTGRRAGGHESCDGWSSSYDDDDNSEISPCSSGVVRYHQVVKDATGKCTEADTHQEFGSLMMVVTPVALTFTDSLALLPVVYESVEGEWSISVSPETPYGFYATPSGALSTSVTDSVVNAVQFAVTDTGSEWTNTKLTHQILHKGAQRVAYSNPAMINERTNKPVEVNITPNPADDQIRITLPKFEGRATIVIYNMLGQAVAEKPIDLPGGASVSMDISSLAAGIYLVSAENTSGKASARLIRKSK